MIKSISFTIVFLLILLGITQAGWIRPTAATLLTPISGSPQAETSVSLAPGEHLELTITGGERHSFRVFLYAGKYTEVLVDQRGIDLAIDIFSPTGEQVGEVDSPIGSKGIERAPVLADYTGEYRIVVRSLYRESAPGVYEIKAAELRDMTESDKDRTAAVKTMMEGRRLRSEGGEKSLRAAAARYDDAATLFRSIGEAQGEAFALNYVGLINAMLGETRNAREIYLRSLALVRSAGSRYTIAVLLNNIGGMCDVVGDANEALDYYKQALDIRRELGDSRMQALTLNNISVVYSNLGDFQKALEYYRPALVIFTELKETAREANTLTNMGIAYTQIGDSEAALDYLRQSLVIRESLKDRRGQAFSLRNIGVIYARLKEPQKALSYYEKALPLSREVGDKRGEATTLQKIGDARLALGESQQALTSYESALTLFIDPVADKPSEASTLINIGQAYAALGDYEKAADYYNRAETLYRSLEILGGEATALYYKAIMERDRGNLKAALSRIENAIPKLESVRERLSSADLRSLYLASNRDYYDLSIDILMRLHRADSKPGYDSVALQINERGRARSLLETLKESGSDIRQGVDPRLLERESRLRQQLNAKEKVRLQLLSTRRSQEQVQASQSEIRDLLAQYQEVQGLIRQRSPRYAALTQPEPLDVKQIQQTVLDEDTLLLEYALGKDSGCVWVVTPTSVQSFALPARSSVEALAKHVYGLLTARNLQVKFETADEKQQRIRQADEEYQRAAAELSRMLLGPIGSLLNGGKRLLVVTEGALQFVPFSALPTPGALDRPLLLDHEVVTLPSASVLAELRKETAGRSPAPKTVAVFADPVFSKGDPRMKPGSSAQERRAIDSKLDPARLPFTGEEAEEIARFAGSRGTLKALGFQANRSLVTSDVLKQYRIIHFATHGLIDNVHPALSGIALSRFNAQGEPQEDTLRLMDVYNLELRADLVVLSACKSGLGKDLRGEGLIGLTRGFMYAGAARVVVTLWDVNDLATARLMGWFYSKMLARTARPVAAALREAQIEMMRTRQWSSPYYWGGFVIQGEWK